MAAAFASMHGLGGVQPGGFANNEKKAGERHNNAAATVVDNTTSGGKEFLP